VDTTRAKLDELGRTLIAVSPESVLSRGYAVIKKNKKYVLRAGDMHAGDNIEIIMSDAIRRAEVKGED